MKTLKLEDKEFYDDETDSFINVKGGVYKFENSLRALAKWESKYCKPFLVNDGKTVDELRYFCWCMCLDDSLDPRLIGDEELMVLTDYMKERPTATTFRDDPTEKRSSTFVTSETLYAKMAESGVPFECDTWNLIRLSTVLRAISEDSKPKRKMSQREIINQNREINAKRRAQLKSKG